MAEREETGRTPNRLIHESSPYLRQHAFNPVKWYPWGQEAFETARKKDLPIFLSIGYSTCHWCHVMAHESFEDEATARILNESFVCIKVDREERPDVDSIYMNATRLLTGGGGWPLSVFLTPTLQPFFAGTYFPPRAARLLPPAACTEGDLRKPPQGRGRQRGRHGGGRRPGAVGAVAARRDGTPDHRRCSRGADAIPRH